MKMVITLSISLLVALRVFSQSGHYDIVHFTAPPGWQRLDSNGVLAFHTYKTSNGLTSFCQIILFPSRPSNKAPIKNFQDEWKDRVVKTTSTKAKPVIKSETTPDGWTSVTGATNIHADKLDYGCVLTSYSGHGRVMSVMINIAGQDYLQEAQDFMAGLELDKNVSFDPNKNPNMSTENFTWSSYHYTAPENWGVQITHDLIMFQNRQSGCQIQMLSPQPSSGDLEKDAWNVFNLMYPGWQFQRSGEQKYLLTRGTLPLGQTFFMVEAPMSATLADGRYTTEEGAALVIRNTNSITIVSVRHASGMIGHDQCVKNYNTWGRFFNSLQTDRVVPGESKKNPKERVIGYWKKTEVAGISEYVFAANGHFARGGTIGTTYTTQDLHYEYLRLATYSFDGDGTYSVAGDTLNLTEKSTGVTESIPFRLAQVNAGGTGWKDRLYLLKHDQYGDNEVLFEFMNEK